MAPPAFKYAFVVSDESMETAQFSVDDSRASVTIDVDMSKNPGLTPVQIIAEILGYSYYNPARTSTYLSRNIPWQHPVFPQLWATQIASIKGRKFVGKKWDAVSLLSYSDYQVLRCNILFTVPPYTILSDADAGTNADAEVFRYTSVNWELSTEAMTRKGVSWRYAKVGGFLPPGVAPGQVLDLGLTRRLIKAKITLKWWHIPAVGFYNPAPFNPGALFGTPANLKGTLGNVNSADWPPSVAAASRFAAGTLLMLNPRIVVEAAPVPNQYLYQNGGAVGGDPKKPPRTVSVETTLLHFDPPVNPSYDGAGTPYPYRGHNLVPLPGAAATPNYWYLATSDNTGTQSPNDEFHLYPGATDFNKAFQLNAP